MLLQTTGKCMRHPHRLLRVADAPDIGPSALTHAGSMPIWTITSFAASEGVKTALVISRVAREALTGRTLVRAVTTSLTEVGLATACRLPACAVARAISDTIECAAGVCKC